MMLNISENYFDAKISLNKVLVSGNDGSGGIVLHVKGNDNELIESFDYNNFVKNLCCSQSYHWIYSFATHTCKQKKHCGIKNVSNWVDTGVQERFILGLTN